jgi:hypothetical protein
MHYEHLRIIGVKHKFFEIQLAMTTLQTHLNY